MRTQFQEILALVRAGKPAERSFEAEDTEYVRNFYPRERLVLLVCGGQIKVLIEDVGD